MNVNVSLLLEPYSDPYGLSFEENIVVTDPCETSLVLTSAS